MVESTEDKLDEKMKDLLKNVFECYQQSNHESNTKIAELKEVIVNLNATNDRLSLSVDDLVKENQSLKQENQSLKSNLDTYAKRENDTAKRCLSCAELVHKKNAVIVLSGGSECSKDFPENLSADKYQIRDTSNRKRSLNLQKNNKRVYAERMSPESKKRKLLSNISSYETSVTSSSKMSKGMRHLLSVDKDDDDNGVDDDDGIIVVPDTCDDPDETVGHNPAEMAIAVSGKHHDRKIVPETAPDPFEESCPNEDSHHQEFTSSNEGIHKRKDSMAEKGKANNNCDQNDVTPHISQVVDDSQKNLLGTKIQPNRSAIKLRHLASLDTQMAMINTMPQSPVFDNENTGLGGVKKNPVEMILSPGDMFSDDDNDEVIGSSLIGTPGDEVIGSSLIEMRKGSTSSNEELNSHLDSSPVLLKINWPKHKTPEKSGLHLKTRKKSQRKALSLQSYCKTGTKEAVLTQSTMSQAFDKAYNKTLTQVTDMDFYSGGLRSGTILTDKTRQQKKNDDELQIVIELSKQEAEKTQQQIEQLSQEIQHDSNEAANTPSKVKVNLRRSPWQKCNRKNKEHQTFDPDETFLPTQAIRTNTQNVGANTDVGHYTVVHTEVEGSCFSMGANGTVSDDIQLSYEQTVEPNSQQSHHWNDNTGYNDAMNQMNESDNLLETVNESVATRQMRKQKSQKMKQVKDISKDDDGSEARDLELTFNAALKMVDESQTQKSPIKQKENKGIMKISKSENNLSRPSRAVSSKLQDSFDVIPKNKTSPEYAHMTKVIRKKADRQKLDGHDCNECKQYYGGMDLSESEKKRRMKQCSRHKARHQPSTTPPHYWDIGFPTTQQCKDRGYLKEDNDVGDARLRRNKPYNQLFTIKRQSGP